MRKLGTLWIVLLIFSLATRVYAQVSASPSPSVPQTIPTPAARGSPDNPAISLAELAQKPEIVTRQEIFLDQHSFSPGKIDGHWGDFCAKALQRYQLAHGQETGSQLDPAIGRELTEISPLYINYQLLMTSGTLEKHHVDRPNRLGSNRCRIVRFWILLRSDIILMRRLSGS